MNQKIKVGILTSHPIQYQVPLFRELAKSYDLIVYYMQDVTPQQQADAGFGVKFIWDVDLYSGYNYEYLENKSSSPDVNSFFGCNTPSVFKKVKQEKFDVFIVMGWYLFSYLQGILACRINNIPLLVRGDSQLATQRSIIKRIIKYLPYRILISQFAGFLIVGKKAREYFEHYGANTIKMFSVPHFIDNDFFKRLSYLTFNELEDIKRKEEISLNHKVLLFVGKFISKKRPLDLIYAAKSLNDKGILATCLFVGSGELEKKIQLLATELNVTIKLAGFKNQTELPKYYAISDLLILPSDSGETWGLVANEALACGKRIVVSDQSGCSSDLIIESVTGSVFKTGEIDELASSIERLLHIEVDDFIIKSIERIIIEYSLASAIEGINKAIEYVTEN